MQGSSHPAPDALEAKQEELKYLYASNTNVSNFVSVKLYGDHNYRLWKTQMLCLMKSHNMVGLVDDRIDGPQSSSREIMDQYDNLLKGWIFGSISEDLLIHVIDLQLAREVWGKLKFIHDPTISSHIDSAKTRLAAKTETQQRYKISFEGQKNNTDVFLGETETKDKDGALTIAKPEDMDVVSVKIEPEDKDAFQIEAISKVKDIVYPTKTKGKEIMSTDEDIKGESKIIRNKELRKAIMMGYWWRVELKLKEDKDAITEAINSDGNTMLHIAVGIGQNILVKEMLSQIESIQLSTMINLEGSTALHIAAIVGNTDAAELLIKKNKSLLEISDHKGETPLDKPYENMHPDTIEYLLKVMNNDRQPKEKSSPQEDYLNPGAKIGVNLLVNAISAKQYDLATNLVNKFPQFVVENDNALMAIARTFPSGLDYGEKLIYPNLDHICERIVKVTRGSFYILGLLRVIMAFSWTMPMKLIFKIMAMSFTVLCAPLLMLIFIIGVIQLLILMVHFPFFMLYFLLWKVSIRVVPPINNIERKKKQWEEANIVLKLVCDKIDLMEFPNAHAYYYTKPVLEAARQNAYEVVDEILMRSPEAIRYKDKNGYDIIQLAVIHRSEKIYNLIYIIGERKSVYRMIEDSSGNNMLHLAGRLAPSHKLKRRTGAALQLQRELQWREEVEKLVFPAYISKENIFMETPDVVFTKEHENLVKEGEEWMKVVAESCSITAALITTIVFAAAITVPGGSNQETGFPLFTDDFAFTIFAISDAISLFASSTSLLVFLSILTGRFAEQDFLISLPRRLIIGLFTLMLSTTSMMVAFGATLFMVFCHRKPWMLAPICLLAFLPIASFATLQIPLIVDLFRSTYGHIFGQQSKNDNNNRFNPDIRLFFGK